MSSRIETIISSHRDKKRESSKARSTTLAWLLMIPAVLLIVIVTLVPMAQAIRLSFHETKFLDVKDFIGFSNYAEFFKNPLSLKNFQNSIVFTFGSLSLSIPLATILALQLAKNFKGRLIFRTILIMPWVVSQLLTSLLWRFVDSPQIGPLAYLLELITGTRIDILGRSSTALFGVAVANVWRTFPYAMILILAALQTIPKELYDAAKIDGAGPWALFRDITFPLIRNTVLIATITLSIHYFNMIELPFVMTGGGPANATDLIGLRVFRESFILLNFGLGSAIAMVMFFMNVLFSIMYIRVLRAESYN